MGPDAWFTLALILTCVMVLVLTRVPPDVVMIGAVGILMATGVLSPEVGLAGFANPATLTVAAFYVVAAGLHRTGALEMFVGRLMAGARTLLGAQWRMMLPVTAMSAFINNTPVVASFLPTMADWARKRGVSPSRLMMPLSFAAILGGACTLVGTSTNLVVNGLLIAETGGPGLGFFELAWVGLPAAAMGTVYVVLASPRLLADRTPVLETMRDAREYTVEMRVDDDSPLAGRTVEDAGLRHLAGLYLVDIQRHGAVLPAPGPGVALEAGDHLVFAGQPESVIELQKIRGLAPVTEQTFKLEAPRSHHRFFEAAVRANSFIAGRTVRESRIRTRYAAVVIAVARDGRRIRGKVGDIRLQGGDTLLLESDRGFARRYRNSRDFLLVRPVDGSEPRVYDRAWRAWLVLGATIAVVVSGVLPLVTGAILGAGAMIATRCLGVSAARNSVDLQVIFVIAAAFGIGEAMRTTGAGAMVGEAIVRVAGDHPLAVLAGFYVATALLTEMITNSATAVLMFPIATATAAELGMSVTPLAVVIAIAASSSFLTPMGYQTNLMVYGPGGYRYTDYVRFGLPLNVLVGVLCLLIVPRVWPLQGL